MLEVSNLAVSYGRHRALEGVAVRVAKGEICVILGANGAGKSTLLKAIAGMVRAERGSEIVMNGTRITAMKRHRIVEQGIALVPEGRGIFGDLTVAENLQLGAFAGRARRDEAATLDFIYSLFPRLAERRKQVARTMSGGEQQMVAIGRALMSKPEILMLDEPSLGLSPLLTQELFRSLKQVAAAGVGILLVEQNAKQSLKIAGRGYLIENGAVTGENSAEALMRDPAVVNAYLGGAGARAIARPTIALPPSMRLPIDLGALGSAVSDLAARAGRIQRAFVRALRQGADLPSAFIGRYDPKAGGDPWTILEAAPAPVAGAPLKVSEDARRLADQSALLAGRAAERLARHVRTARLSSPRPSGFAQPGRAVEEPIRASELDSSLREPEAAPTLIGHNSGNGEIDDQPPVTNGDAFAELAARAAERSAAFVRARRLAAPPASGLAQPKSPTEHHAPQPHGEKLNGSHGLIGHNSARFELEETPAAPPQSGLLSDPSFAELAARAASIHATHVADRRRRLAAFVLPAAPQPDIPSAARQDEAKAAKKAANAGKHHSKDSAKKKRKKHKEA